MNELYSLIWSTSFLGWFSYFYLGIYLKNSVKNNLKSKVLVSKSYFALLFLSLIIQILEGFFLYLKGEINCGTQLKLSCVLTNTIFLLLTHCWLISSNKMLLDNKVLKLFKLIGDYSFGIFKYFNYYFLVNKWAVFPLKSAIYLVLSLGFCVLGYNMLGEKIGKIIGFK